MAEGAVFQLLSSFAPYLQEDLNLLTGVGEEIQCIKRKFEHMSSFLRVADELEEKKPELKVWVKQVREAAYDTADALDMYMLRLGHHHGPGFRGFLRKVSCFIKTFKARYQIASEVKRIKSRVVDISEDHQRYSEIYGTVDHQQPWYDCRGDALLLQDADLVGIDDPKSQLIPWLVDEEDPRLKVLSIAGMGGLGKTTLTKKIYDDPIVKNHFKNHAWITISESPNVDQLLKDMIRQLFEEVKQPLPQRVDVMDTNSLKSTINAFLKQKRYLLVLDDVWTINAWQVLKIAFPECNSGSRILLTTRHAEIASFASQENHGRVYYLQPLPRKESWDLFCKKTFQGNSCPAYLVDISRDILTRCEGLPLAIVAIGGLLSTKEKNMDEWERICRSLGAELEGNDKLMNINKILSVSYFDLPYYLKLCFLYLSIFPEDCLVDHFRLIRLWVAEEFVEVKERMTKEEVADGYLNELINRSLVQVANVRNDGRFEAYRIHDLWREIIITKSREQNIVTIVSERDIAWPEKVRRLTVYQDLEDIQQSDCFTRLRSLLVFSASDSLSILSKLASVGDRLKLLTVLDLEGTQLETFPNEIVKLIHLTYLSLRWTKVKMIPKSIEKLKKLETLDLKHTNVVELPDNILKLQHLRHLLLYRYHIEGSCYFPFHSQSGFIGPGGIGKLSSLQKLCAIEANHGSNGNPVVREVGKLTQLRRLQVLRVRKEDGRVLCSSLEKLNNLRALVVHATEQDEIIDLDSLSLTPPLLQRLYLKGRLQKLPHWIPALYNLKKIYLRWSKLRSVDDPLQSLQDLPNLLFLELDLAYEGDGLCFKAGRFQKLRTLLLLRLEGLRWVRVEAGSMPLLEKLWLRKCKLMTELPSGIEHLSHLKCLELLDMSDSLISRLDRKGVQGGGKDYWKVEHIPKVIVGDTSTGIVQGYYL